MSTTKLPPESFSDEFPRRMGRPANAALVAMGITTLDQVTRMTESELAAVHGVGPQAIRILREELSARGMALRA